MSQEEEISFQNPHSIQLGASLSTLLTFAPCHTCSSSCLHSAECSPAQKGPAPARYWPQETPYCQATALTTEPVRQEYV